MTLNLSHVSITKKTPCISNTWRIIASFTTFIIGWIVTGDLNFGMAIGAADVLIKIALYYFHERLWYHSKFGVLEDGKHIYKPIFRRLIRTHEVKVPTEPNTKKS